jgi:hypothetical protein
MFVVRAGNYTEAERMRVLGQSGNRVYEKHYQSGFMAGLQSVVLLRPSHAALCNEARKSRNRDPLAPKELNDEQLAALCRDPLVLCLRREKADLKNEIRKLAGTIGAAKESHPELYQKHEQVCKRLQKARKRLYQEAKEKIKEQYFNNIPIIEVNKQINQLQGNSDLELSDIEDNDKNEDNSEEPDPPKYVFQERARIVEAFYGPDAETLDGKAALARRIQVTRDITMLYKLSKPSRRGKRFNWNQGDEDDVDDLVEIK